MSWHHADKGSFRSYRIELWSGNTIACIMEVGRAKKMQASSINFSSSQLFIARTLSHLTSTQTCTHGASHLSRPCICTFLVLQSLRLQKKCYSKTCTVDGLINAYVDIRIYLSTTA
jgi:hypothetical protein